MNLEELKEALEELIPTATFLVSEKNEVIISTGLLEDEDGELIVIEDLDETFDFKENVHHQDPFDNLESLENDF